MTTTPAEPTSGPTPIVFCARHPETETGLSCGRCGTPICPRCLVYTPAGTRCPDCAMLRRPPMYELKPLDYARAIAAGAVMAGPLGFAGAILGSIRLFASFGIFIALAIGYGAGIAVAWGLDLATNRKRGTAVQVIAAATIVAAAILRLWFGGAPLAFVLRDVTGGVIAAVAILVAWTRLR